MRVREQEVDYDLIAGHTHDGEDSRPVALVDGQVELRHLSANALEYIADSGLGGISADQPAFEPTEINLANVPELEISVPELDPDEEYDGEEYWVNAALVSYISIGFSADTLCEITFYHLDTYDMADREFRAVECTDGFMWEGVWAHIDENSTGKVYFKVKNVGDTAAEFTVTLKSATMVANEQTYTESIVTTESSSTRDISVSDIGALIKCTDTCTLTLPRFADEEIPVGSRVDILRYGSGGVTIAGGSGVTVRTAVGNTITNQYGMVSAQKIDTDEWVIVGDTT